MINFSFKLFLESSYQQLLGWHTTTPEVAEKIIKDGFDPTLMLNIGYGAKKMGAGWYFTSTLENSIEYSQAVASPNSTEKRYNPILEVEINPERFIALEQMLNWNNNVKNAIDSLYGEKYVPWNEQLNKIAPNYPFESLGFKRQGMEWNVNTGFDALQDLHLDKFINGIITGGGKSSQPWIIVYNPESLVRIKRIGYLKSDNKDEIEWKNIDQQPEKIKTALPPVELEKIKQRFNVLSKILQEKLSNLKISSSLGQGDQQRYLDQLGSLVKLYEYAIKYGRYNKGVIDSIESQLANSGFLTSATAQPATAQPATAQPATTEKTSIFRALPGETQAAYLKRQQSYKKPTSNPAQQPLAPVKKPNNNNDDVLDFSDYKFNSNFKL